ncbi:hypothetical protein [Marinomonas gallaica]|uniref:hypothetical protein n=1 Tax=Marinomonas gallaica TaxID=1806667 RepID=UPI003A90509A
MMNEKDYMHPSPPMISLLLLVLVTMLSIVHMAFSAVLLIVGFSVPMDMAFLVFLFLLSFFILSSIKISLGNDLFIKALKFLAYLSLILSAFLIFKNEKSILGLAYINFVFVFLTLFLMTLKQYREGVVYRKKHLDCMREINKK